MRERTVIKITHLTKWMGCIVMVRCEQPVADADPTGLGER